MQISHQLFVSLVYLFDIYSARNMVICCHIDVVLCGILWYFVVMVYSGIRMYIVHHMYSKFPFLAKLGCL